MSLRKGSKGSKQEGGYKDTGGSPGKVKHVHNEGSPERSSTAPRQDDGGYNVSIVGRRK